MNIYLAGKIGKNDWRHSLVRGLRVTSAMMEDNRHPLWPILVGAIFEAHNYTGPFFISCNHGCYHGNNQHGVGRRTEGCFNDPPEDGTIIQLCQNAIRKSDLVFAWIDDQTAFGTLVEIGYALGAGVRVAISGPEKQHDLWFAYSSSDAFIPAQSPEEGLRIAIRQHFKGMAYRDYLQTAHWELTRAAALERAKHRCQLCNGLKGGLNVHHRTYERLGNELPEDLIVLCRDCHTIFHKEGKLAR
jgi:hypothetical protein